MAPSTTTASGGGQAQVAPGGQSLQQAGLHADATACGTTGGPIARLVDCGAKPCDEVTIVGGSSGPPPSPKEADDEYRPPEG